MALTGVPPAAFMRTGNPEDPRAQRTRALLLAEAERQIAAVGQLPSVAALVNAAGVSRGAFYTHFTSMEDLAVAAVRAVLEEFGAEEDVRDAQAGPEQRSAQRSYGSFFAHIAEHGPLFAALVATTSDGSAREELRAALVDQLASAITTNANSPAGTDPRHGAAFIAGGILGLLSEWLNAPAPIDPHQLAEQMTHFLPHWLIGPSQDAPPIHVELR